MSHLNIEKYSLKYKKIGQEVIKKKEVGCIILAGGMGTRLGIKNPKGFFKINNKSMFEHILDRIKKTEKIYKKRFSIAIMTSFQNHEKTIKFFEKNKFFGFLKDQIDFFMQEDRPLLDEKGQHIIKNGKILSGPDGNGSFFEIFRKKLFLLR